MFFIINVSNISYLFKFLYQSISLRIATFAPWYVSNLTLHKNLSFEPVANLVKTHYKKFHSKLLQYPNPLIANQYTVSNPSNPPCILKRCWCCDLLD